MKSSYAGLFLLAIGLMIGFLVGAGAMERNANAQAVPIRQLPSRFQISAWGMGYGTGNGFGKGERGCYIVDTVTGELWHAPADGKPNKISEKLQ